MTMWVKSDSCEREMLPTSLHFLMIPFRPVNSHIRPSTCPTQHQVRVARHFFSLTDRLFYSNSDDTLSSRLSTL